MTPQLLLFILLNIAAAIAIAILIASIAGRWGFPYPSLGNRLGAIDGLRGYLAAGVMAHHFILWLQVERLGGEWAPLAINLFNQLGAGAVSLFFMVTGFLFYPRVLAGFRETSWTRLLIGRAFRILPLIVVTVAFISLIVKSRGAVGRPDIGPYLLWFTSFGEPPLLGYPDTGRINAYVLWSLWYEWVFYLAILPFSALFRDLLPKRAPSWIIPVNLLAVSVVGQLFTSWKLFEFCPYFAVGMIAFELQRMPLVATFLRRSDISFLSLACLFVGMVVAPFPNGFALLLFAFFFISVACGNNFWGLLRLRGSLVLGDCSYSIYLIHGIFLSVMFVEGKGVVSMFETPWLPAALPAAMAIVVIASIGSYLLIERPMVDAGRALAGALERTLGRARKGNRPLTSAELGVAP